MTSLPCRQGTHLLCCYVLTTSKITPVRQCIHITGCHFASPCCSALQLDTCTVRTWRSACLLLRVCWDTMPELRPLYAEFIDRLEDGIKRLSRCGN
jgi:hypothetical protein